MKKKNLVITVFTLSFITIPFTLSSAERFRHAEENSKKIHQQQKEKDIIQQLKKEVREDGFQYYKSLAHKKAKMPCGTAKGYILNDGKDIREGLTKLFEIESKNHENENSFGSRIPFLPIQPKYALGKFLELLWKGKTIKMRQDSNKSFLTNHFIHKKIGLKGFEADVYFLDEATINIDYSRSSYPFVKNIRDEIRQVSENVYLGKAFYITDKSKNNESFLLYFALDFRKSKSCETIDSSSLHKTTSLPKAYKSWEGCKKMDYLWENYILETEYEILPSLDEAKAMALLKHRFKGQMKTKMDFSSDIVPEGYFKPIHSKGSLAKVRFEVNPKNPFTGLYQSSSQCALIRLSLTSNPHQKKLMSNQERGVAPGIALKFFISGQNSQDISFLTSLKGQGDDYNFFAHTFSNIITPGKGFDMKAVHYLFRTISKHPEKLSAHTLSSWTPQGVFITNPSSPTQLFLVPEYQNTSQEQNEDIRSKFHKIPQENTLFKVYGYTSQDPFVDYKDYTELKAQVFLNKSTYIGKIITNSPFISSYFGDAQIFFKHRRFEEDYKKISKNNLKPRTNTFPHK